MGRIAFDKAGQEFNRVVKGKNIMTPDVIRYGFARGDKLVYELSKGRGIFNDTIYGVTVVYVGDPEGSRGGRDLSKCCHSLSEVNDHIDSLNGEEENDGKETI